MSITRLVGLELETEGLSLYDLGEGTYWDYHEEPSLRGDHTEFVLKDPLKGRKLNSSLAELHTHLLDERIYLSDRCSLHVHVDVRDLTKKEIYNVCLAYSLFEQALYELSGKRNYSKYCVPLSMSSSLQRNVASLYDGTNTADRGSRYGGLNLDAVNKFGSLEFRMHKGSLDVKAILEWCQVLHDLVSNTYTLDPHAILLKGSTQERLVEFADEIFYSSLVKSYLVSERYSWRNYDTKTSEQIHLLALRGRNNGY